MKKFVAGEQNLQAVREQLLGCVQGLHSLEVGEVKAWLKKNIPEYTPYVD